MLSDEQKEVCQQAVQVFGRRWQTIKVAEELRELADELEKAVNGTGATLERVIDERADVEIMLYQLDELILPGVARRVPARIPVKIEKLKSYMR
jgi:hypothetical protein